MPTSQVRIRRTYQFCSEVGKIDSVELFTFGDHAHASCRWIGETDTQKHCLTKEVVDACPLTCKDCCGDVSFSFEVSGYGNLTCDASESFCFVSSKFRQNCPIKCNTCDNPWDLRNLSEETGSDVNKHTEVDCEIGEDSSSVASHDLPCSPLVIITEASVVPTLRLNPLNNNQEVEPKKLGIVEISAILVGPLFLCGIILYLISKRENKISNKENNERFWNENDTSNGVSEPDVKVRNKAYCQQTAITQKSSFIDADSNNLAKISSLMNVHNCGMYPCYSCSKKKMTKFVQVGKNNHFPQIENVNATGSRPFVSMDLGNSLDSTDEYSAENDTSNGVSEPDVKVRNKSYCQETAITQKSSFIDADSNNLAKISSLMNVHNCGMYPCYSCSKKKMTKFVQVGKNNHFPQIENVNGTGSRPFVSMDLGNSLDSTDEYSACAFENQTTSNSIDETDEEFSTVML